MKRLEVPKILFYTALITSLVGLSFAFGLYSAVKKTVVYETVRALKNSVADSLTLVFEEASTLTKIHPKHYLQPARYDGSGVTVNDVEDSGENFVFLSGFFDKSNELRLILRSGSVVARWPVSFSDIFTDTTHLDQPDLWEPPKTNWNIDIHGALALADASVVFNFEYGGLVKLDRCGNVVWKLARSTHHSIEHAEGGGYWVPGRRYVASDSDSPFPPFETPFKEDTIMKISEDGKVLMEISVPKLFYDNGLEALLTATGHWFRPKMDWDNEIVHLNKIEALSSSISKAFPMFKAGDLALSLREQNLIMILNPETGKIKWWQIGPWVRQHDPEFTPNGKMIIFNNNGYDSTFKKSVSDANSLYMSNIVELDFATNEYRIIYGGKKGQKLATRLRGKHELSVNGGLLVTEFEGGRVFETDAAGRIIWEYVNRYDSDMVAEISDARIYPSSYFRISDWSCE